MGTQLHGFGKLRYVNHCPNNRGQTFGCAVEIEVLCDKAGVGTRQENLALDRFFVPQFRIIRHVDKVLQLLPDSLVPRIVESGRFRSAEFRGNLGRQSRLVRKAIRDSAGLKTDNNRCFSLAVVKIGKYVIQSMEFCIAPQIGALTGALPAVDPFHCA